MKETYTIRQNYTVISPVSSFICKILSNHTREREKSHPTRNINNSIAHTHFHCV